MLRLHSEELLPGRCMEGALFVPHAQTVAPATTGGTNGVQLFLSVQILNGKQQNKANKLPRLSQLEVGCTCLLIAWW